MRPRARVFALLASCLLPLAHAAAQIVSQTITGPPAGAAGQTPGPITGSGLITGRVIDVGTGAPLAGAIVTLGSTAMSVSMMSFGGGPTISFNTPTGIGGRGGQSTLRVITDGQGRFVFRDLPRGSFGFSVTVSGYVGGGYGQRRPTGPFQPLELADGQKLGGVSLPMWKYAAIGGTITDEAGEPVVGLSVSLLQRTIVAGRRRLSPSGQAGRTDDRGIYRIGMLVPGEYVVAAAVTQSALPYDPVAAAQGPPGRGRLGTPNVMQVGDSLRLIGGGGAVAPAPVEGARASAYETQFYPGVRTPTDAAAITIGSGDERTGIDLQLRLVPTVTVSGTVIGPSGPMANQSLRLVAATVDDLQTESGFETATTQADARGVFAFLDVTPGQYMLRANRAAGARGGGPNVVMFFDGPGGGPMTMPSDAMLWANLPVSVGEADRADVNVVLRSGMRISGKVQFDGTKPPPPAEALRTIPVLIATADGRGLAGLPSTQLRGQIDPSGQFTAASLPAGRYLISAPASAPGGWSLKSVMVNGRDISIVPLELEGSDVSGVVITFTDRPTELSGSVQNSSGVDADATVLLFPADDQSWTDAGGSPRRMKTARSAKNGSYRFTNVPDGDYFVAAVRDEIAGDWPDPKFLESLRSSATRVSINDGEKKTLDLRTIK